MTKYIGVDLGQKKCGFSLGNDITRTSSPLLTYKTRTPEELLDYLEMLCRQYGAQKVVIGDPLRSHSGVHPLTSFIKHFQAVYDVQQPQLSFEIIWWDESYTSQLATDLHSRYPDHSRDAHAATLILGSFLNNF